MTLVWEVPLDPSSLLTLLALADHANDEGKGVYPGNKRLARKCSTSVRQIQYNLKHLEEHGLIKREKYAKGGRGHAVEWSVNAVLCQTVHEAARFLEKGAMCDRKGCNVDPQSMHWTAPQPSGTIINREDSSISEENPRREGEGLRDYLARLADIAGSN